MQEKVNQAAFKVSDVFYSIFFLMWIKAYIPLSSRPCAMLAHLILIRFLLLACH